MRADAIGLFWEDHAKVKAAPKEKIKRTPPERTWEHPDYLPGLEQALAFRPNLFLDWELGQAAQAGEQLIFDIESYPNYTLLAFRSIQSKKCIVFELNDEPCGLTYNPGMLRWVLDNFCIIDFNGRKYDEIITALAVAGKTALQMYEATKMIIEFEARPADVYKKFKVKKYKIPNQIDLIELTALAPGLKVCAGRLHAKRMQDLPFVPGTYLSDYQVAITRMYCFNDLDNTELLYHNVTEQIKVREETGGRYGLDLRSHSDAQMAEAIISSEVKRLTGEDYVPRTQIIPGTSYKYNPPSYIKFHSELMNWVLSVICNADFVVGEDGAIQMPPELGKLKIDVNKSSYKLGIGGLHSQEKSVAHVADDEYFIADSDVTSYYPNLILNAGLFPPNLGKLFAHIYRAIVDERVNAKKAGLAIIAECLKIVVNGTFGKLGSKYSIVYAPNLLIQVTITGQLSLLMLVERFELAGIEVTSANTDGIIVKCKRSMRDTFNAIVKQWEKETGFATEETRYKATYNRDINNYIAVYEEPQKGKRVKTKGVYAETAPKKNAVNEICVDAVTAKILDNIPVAETIRNCKDVWKFTTMRAVSGGAVKDGDYLGKVIRWIYTTEAVGEIISAKSGNKVPRTEGAQPLMELPDSIPEDIVYQWYEDEAEKILQEIGYS